MPTEFKRTTNLPQDKQLILADPNNPEHFDIWVRIYQAKEVTPFVFIPYDTPRKEIEIIYKKYLANERAFFFLYTDANGKVVSTCRMTLLPGHRNHVAAINAVATDPAQHGKGFGTKMLEAGMTFMAQEYDVEQFELSYEPDNPAGWRLYENYFGFKTVVTINNQWPREIEFLKKFHWPSTVRCAELYQNPSVQDRREDDIKKFDVPILATQQSLKILIGEKDYSIETWPNSFINSLLDKHSIFQEYTSDEIQEIRNTLAANSQTLYCLKNKDDQLVALLSLYAQTDPRSEHTGILPIFLIANDLDNTDAASFLCAALHDFRDTHEEVYHYLASGQFTSVAWYTTKQSHIKKISQVLQEAGFVFDGVYTNHFNSNAPLGRDLLCYEFCFLGLTDAQRCVKLNNNLNNIQKQDLIAKIDTIKNLQINFSAREQYELFRMVQVVACRYDFTLEEQKALLKKHVSVLQKSAHFNQLQIPLAELVNTIKLIIKSQENALPTHFFSKKSENPPPCFRPALLPPHTGHIDESTQNQPKYSPWRCVS